VKDFEDLPEITRQQINHFFEHYKDLEPGKWVKILGWEGPEAARREIMDGIANYKKEHG
jgi:inorganic pyrophosphatase